MIGASESYRVEKILAVKRPIQVNKKTPSQICDELMKRPIKKNILAYNYKFLVKWEDLEYKYITWEDEFIVLKFRDKIKQYFTSRQKNKDRMESPAKEHLPKFVDFEVQPSFIKGQLFDYQIKGFKWLINQFLQKKNAILADEMGLGKTIQTLCFLKYLSTQFKINGPFLVIAPNSTIYNWQREAQKWCPEYDVVVYVGDATSRRKLIDFEFFGGKDAESRQYLRPKFQLLITTYTHVNIDVVNLKKIKWETVVVDEAQRLKNKESKLYKLCDRLKTRFKLLLTGTPIQNSIEELINLFMYLIPKESSLVREVEDLTVKLTLKNTTDPVTGMRIETNEVEKKKALGRLRGILKEHMLRRTVQDANLKFPDLEEKVVKLNLTNQQKHLYKNILVRNYEVLSNAEAAAAKQSGRPKKAGEGLRVSLINILMHLRLVCDHPDLFYSTRREYVGEEGAFEDQVVKGSNKLKLLEKMIPRLLNEGHKILMFTQFVLMLDIIEEFLIFKKLDYERLDGSTRNSDRQKIIDSFNNGKSKIFILSTRAGGLGINLTSSDTVIFVDSDFNPYRDIQAFCRAYRIGQKNNVMVYRLVSAYTVEEKIVDNANKKLMMGEMIMNPVDQSKEDKSIVESILRYGTKELFDKITDDQDNDEITEEKLDELLRRDPKPAEKVQRPKANDLNDYYLNGFDFADFRFTPILQKGATVEETKDNKYWETIMGDEYSEFEKKGQEDLGKGKRNKKVNPTHMGSGSDSDDSVDIQIRIEVSSSPGDTMLYNTDSEYDIGEFEQKKNNRSTFSSEDDEEKERIQQSILTLPESLQEYYSHLENVYEDVKGKNREELWGKYKLDEVARMKLIEFVLRYGISTKVEDLTRQ